MRGTMQQQQFSGWAQEVQLPLPGLHMPTKVVVWTTNMSDGRKPSYTKSYKGELTRRGPAYSARKTVDHPICNPRSWIDDVWFYWRGSKLVQCLEIEECPSFDAKAFEGVCILQWLPARFKPQLLSESFIFQIRAAFFAWACLVFSPVDIPVLGFLPC